MLRSILIGLDGTSDNEGAIELGLAWAKEHDAVAAGVATIDESGILVSEQAMFATGFHRPIAEPLVDVARQHSRVTLEKFRVRCHELHVRCKAMTEDGTPYVRLLEDAQRYDLVVLGQQTHFEYGWKEQADETLARVLRDCPRPVVAVPKSPLMGKAVIVAYDGSLQSARALYAFVASGLGQSRTVYVVSVDSFRSEATHHANRAIEFLQDHDIRATDVAIESHGDPAEAILKEVRRRDSGLLVMGAYGQPTLKEFFVGSVTRSILERSPVAVFCYH